MKSGIEFFDRHEPKGGDLWIIGGGPASGKSTILENLAAGFALTSEISSTFCGLEKSPSQWLKTMLQINRAKSDAANCASNLKTLQRLVQFTNTPWVEGSFSAFLVEVHLKSQRKVLFVDYANLFIGGHPSAEHIIAMKSTAARGDTLIIAAIQLSQALWSSLEITDNFNPQQLPSDILSYADVVFTTGRRNEPGEFSLLECRTKDGVSDRKKVSPTRYSIESSGLLVLR